MSEITDERLTEVLALCQGPPEGPWFASVDDADDAAPHKNSGLSMVDTGRQSDWPVARLTEAKTAKYIAAIDPDFMRALITELQERRASSPAAGRDAVIEECAKVVDDFNAQGSALATTTVALMLVAQELRALKETPNGN